MSVLEGAKAFAAQQETSKKRDKEKEKEKEKENKKTLAARAAAKKEDNKKAFDEEMKFQAEKAATPDPAKIDPFSISSLDTTSGAEKVKPSGIIAATSGKAIDEVLSDKPVKNDFKSAASGKGPKLKSSTPDTGAAAEKEKKKEKTLPEIRDDLRDRKVRLKEIYQENKNTRVLPTQLLKKETAKVWTCPALT
jgi:hypothetical protein